MEEIVEGWKSHNQIAKSLGLTEMTKEEYEAAFARTSLEEHEDAIHALLRNPPKAN